MVNFGITLILSRDMLNRSLFLSILVLQFLFVSANAQDSLSVDVTIEPVKQTSISKVSFEFQRKSFENKKMLLTSIRFNTIHSKDAEIQGDFSSSKDPSFEGWVNVREEPRSAEDFLIVGVIMPPGTAKKTRVLFLDITNIDESVIPTEYSITTEVRKPHVSQFFANSPDTHLLIPRNIYFTPPQWARVIEHSQWQNKAEFLEYSPSPENAVSKVKFVQQIDRRLLVRKLLENSSWHLWYFLLISFTLFYQFYRVFDSKNAYHYGKKSTLVLGILGITFSLVSLFYVKAYNSPLFKFSFFSFAFGVSSIIVFIFLFSSSPNKVNQFLNGVSPLDAEGN